MFILYCIRIVAIVLTQNCRRLIERKFNVKNKWALNRFVFAYKLQLVDILTDATSRIEANSGKKMMRTAIWRAFGMQPTRRHWEMKTLCYNITRCAGSFLRFFFVHLACVLHLHCEWQDHRDCLHMCINWLRECKIESIRCLAPFCNGTACNTRWCVCAYRSSANSSPSNTGSQRETHFSKLNPIVCALKYFTRLLLFKHTIHSSFSSLLVQHCCRWFTLGGRLCWVWVRLL